MYTIKLQPYVSRMIPKNLHSLKAPSCYVENVA